MYQVEEMGVEVCGLLCINDEQKSGVVLGYFLCISQLNSRRPGGMFFHLTMTNSRVPLIQIYLS